MSTPLLHDDEIDVTVDQVAHRVARHFPDARGQRVRRVHPGGTVNALFRVGEEFVVRIPRRSAFDESLVTECRWLAYLSPALSVATPEPLALFPPEDDVGRPWAVFRWIRGESLDAALRNEPELARDLARVVAELRAVPVAEGPRRGRPPLADVDAETRAAIRTLARSFDHAVITRAWDRALAAPTWTGEGVWRHADLLVENLLARDGRLGAVLDWGAVGVGDPAHDLLPAWSVLTPAGRAIFRAGLEVDDGTWARARGYALQQAILIIPYYATTLPGFAASAARTLARVLDDPGE